MQGSGFIKIISLVVCQLSGACGPVFLRVHYREWPPSDDRQMAGILLPWGSLAYVGGLQLLIALLRSSPLG